MQINDLSKISFCYGSKLDNCSKYVSGNNCILCNHTFLNPYNQYEQLEVEMHILQKHFLKGVFYVYNDKKGKAEFTVFICVTTVDNSNTNSCGAFDICIYHNADINIW